MKPPLALTIFVMLILATATGAVAGEPGGPAPGDDDRLAFSISTERANFRAGVVHWIYARNNAVGWVSDFALPGSELPLHLDVDPGDREFVLAWKFRFR